MKLLLYTYKFYLKTWSNYSYLSRKKYVLGQVISTYGDDR